MRALIVLGSIAAAACATMGSTFTDAHRGSLITLASKDFSCPRDQMTASESGANESVWTAQGCGQTATYKLMNHACLIERDCAWELQTPRSEPRQQ